MTTPTSSNDRSIRSRANRKAAGSRQISVMLTPEANAALLQHTLRGSNGTAVICDLLVQSMRSSLFSRESD